MKRMVRPSRRVPAHPLVELTPAAKRDRVVVRLFHYIVVAGAAATVLLTWPLWQVRTMPPMIAVLPLPLFSVGPFLLAALVVATARPREGLIAYAAVVAYAMLTDWTRLQPAMVSFAVLMAAGLPGQGGRAIARAHVVSLWFYAGFHKLLSPEFLADRRDPIMLRHLGVQLPPGVREYYPEAVIAAEIGLALAATFPATRRLAGVWALALHAGILTSISPLGGTWNPSVWPWNVVLGAAGILLIAPWKEPVTTWFAAQLPVVRVAIVVLALYPALSQFGIGDPYLAHHLYSRSTPISYVCRDADPPPFRAGLGDVYRTNDARYQCRFVDFFPWLNIPEPGEHVYVRTYFERTCEETETLVIRERRRFFNGGKGWLTQYRCAQRPSLTASDEPTNAGPKQGFSAHP